MKNETPETKGGGGKYIYKCFGHEAWELTGNGKKHAPETSP